MTDRFPTFRRWSGAPGRAWARFSYSDSFAAQGAVWTISAWLIGGGLITLFAYLEGALVEGGSRGIRSDAPVVSMLLVFPGSPVIAFICGTVLSGRPAGLFDSLKRGLKVSAFLFFSLQTLAILTLTFGDEKAGLVAAILFWIGVSALLAGLVGGFMRWVGNRALPQARPAPAGAAASPITAGPVDAWLEAVAGELRREGLFDHATATAVYKALQSSGRAAPDAPPPLEARYEEIFTKLQALFPDKKREQWLEANARLRQAMLLTAKAGGGVKAARAAMRDSSPNLSDAFYEWLADRARQLP